MKQMKREPHIYKASNVTFDAKAISARSYQHWEFVRVINGLVIFNSYRYSVTTAKHQCKVRQLMSKLGIKIDFEIETRMSLDKPGAIADAVQSFRVQAKILLEETAKPNTRKAKNMERVDSARKLEEKALNLQAFNAAFGESA